MNHSQKRLLRESWAQVVPLGNAAAALFYDRLFTIDPKLSILFGKTDFTVQHDRLLQAINYVVQNLDNLETLLPTLEQLGERHASYGVQNEHYESVGAALLWTLQQGLAENWTLQIEQAWTDAYAMIASVMQGEPLDVVEAIGVPVTVVSTEEKQCTI